MLRHISSYTHAVATTPAEQLGALVARLPQLQRPSLVYGQVGFRITLFEACSAFTHVTACVLAKSPKATLYTGGFSGFVASTTAPIATGWSDPCRVGFAPTEDVRLSTAHRKPGVMRSVYLRKLLVVYVYKCHFILDSILIPVEKNSLM